MDRVIAAREPEPATVERAAARRRRRVATPSPDVTFDPAPVTILDRPLASTRIHRTVVDSSTVRPPVTTIRRAGAGVIRRAIDDDTWTKDVEARMGGGKSVTVWVDGEPVVLRMNVAQLEEFNKWTEQWVAVDAGRLADIKRDGERLPAHLGKDPSYKATEAVSSDGFTVSDFKGERLSLVHHTKMDKAEDSHLTVENAHVLAFAELFGAKSPRDARDKTEEDKKTINEALTKGGHGTVDNVNFYAAAPKAKAKGKGGSDDSLTALTLDAYVRFIAQALDKGGAPREYGDRVLTYATEMARQSKLDMKALMMRAGKGDEKAFIRAVLIIESQIPGMTLNIDGNWRTIFEKWWTVAGNDPKVPYLPENSTKGEAKRKDKGKLVREGEVAPSGDSYSVLEGLYCTKAFDNVAKAVKGYLPEVPRAVLPVPVEQKANVGSGGKPGNTPKIVASTTPSQKPGNQKVDNTKQASGKNTPTNKTPNTKTQQKGNSKRL